MVDLSFTTGRLCTLKKSFIQVALHCKKGFIRSALQGKVFIRSMQGYVDKVVHPYSKKNRLSVCEEAHIV